MFESIRVFIGYDEREAIAYHACCQSLIENSTSPLEIHPLALRNLKGYSNTAHTDGSNAFIYSRFLVPYLCNWQGFAIFLDGDMIVREDISKLWALRDQWSAVQVCQHSYRTKKSRKYLGNKNEDYPRKNWSSVIIWNCGHYGNRKLTPDYVASASGAELHRFTWLPDERVGALPLDWNHLVGEFGARPDASIYHYTLGIPAFSEYEFCDNADQWWKMVDHAMKPLSHVDLKPKE